jgi:hypothetical protein
LSGHSEFITRITNQTNNYLNSQPLSKAKISLPVCEKRVNYDFRKARIVDRHRLMMIFEELGLMRDKKAFDSGFK